MNTATTTHEPGPVRRWLAGWLAGERNREHRFFLFATIVGTTTANLIAAGVIAVIAVLTGHLHISFHWSWQYFWGILVPIAIIIGGLTFVGVIIAYFAARKDEQPLGMWGAIGAALFYFLVFTAFFAFLLTLIDALNIYLTHAKRG